MKTADWEFRAVFMFLESVINMKSKNQTNWKLFASQAAMPMILGLLLGTLMVAYLNISANININVESYDQSIWLRAKSTDSTDLLTLQNELHQQLESLKLELEMAVQQKKLYQLRSKILENQISDYRQVLILQSEHFQNQEQNLTETIERIEREVISNLQNSNKPSLNRQHLMRQLKNSALWPKLSQEQQKIISQEKNLAVLMDFAKFSTETDTKPFLSMKTIQPAQFYINLTFHLCSKNYCLFQLNWQQEDPYQQPETPYIQYLIQNTILHSVESSIDIKSDSNYQKLVLFCHGVCKTGSVLNR